MTDTTEWTVDPHEGTARDTMPCPPPDFPVEEPTLREGYKLPLFDDI